MPSKDKVQFRDIPLYLHDPKWGSDLANTIIELEKLRVKHLGVPVPPYVFFQLKEAFQMLESLGSARIEGNNTTLAEVVEKMIEDPEKKSEDEKLREIYNIERAIDFVEKNVNGDTVFDRALISEIHKIIVEGLTAEGSKYPGQLRPINVSISQSDHCPPDTTKVSEYFDELMRFVNQSVDSQYHLLLIALSHHRMAWIHPFDNGNGRLIRVFTYALLIKQGFKVKSGRILNPTAIFCMDRNRYYEMLAVADQGTETSTLDWCSYVLNGLRIEIEKIDLLLDLRYVTETILLPILLIALENQHITKREYEILRAIVKNEGMSIKSVDLNKIIGDESSVQRSRILRKLKEKRMIIPLKQGGRVYTIMFTNNYLMRGLMKVLKENNFIPESLENKI